MLIMKKDMGGAANVLAAARMIMDAKLKVRLRVLIPAVENAIAGEAFRPLDVYRSRKGITVEIGNTDAEGRLVLADALALADEEKPDLIVDMATLTGAARVALGPELPPFFTHDEALAADLMRHAQAERDPMWRLPLWRPYDSLLESKIADINNVGSVLGFFQDPNNGYNFTSFVKNGDFTTLYESDNFGIRLWSMNDVGQLVGERFQGQSGFGTAILYNANGTVTDISYPGSTNSGAFGINNLGQIVGFWGDNPIPSNDGVPEPASWAMMIAGFGAVGASMRRRRRAWAAG